MDSNGTDKPNEQQGNNKKNKKRRWWKEKANKDKKNKEIKKAKDLREELLKLQEYMNSTYHNSND